MPKKQGCPYHCDSDTGEENDTKFYSQLRGAAIQNWTTKVPLPLPLALLFTGTKGSLDGTAVMVCPWVWGCGPWPEYGGETFFLFYVFKLHYFIPYSLIKLHIYTFYIQNVFASVATRFDLLQKQIHRYIKTTTWYKDGRARSIWYPKRQNIRSLCKCLYDSYWMHEITNWECTWGAWSFMANIRMEGYFLCDT